jgi:hypothetical protein
VNVVHSLGLGSKIPPSDCFPFRMFLEGLNVGEALKTDRVPPRAQCFWRSGAFLPYACTSSAAASGQHRFMVRGFGNDLDINALSRVPGETAMN